MKKIKLKRTVLVSLFVTFTMILMIMSFTIGWALKPTPVEFVDDNRYCEDGMCVPNNDIIEIRQDFKDLNVYLENLINQDSTVHWESLVYDRIHRIQDRLHIIER